MKLNKFSLFLAAFASCGILTLESCFSTRIRTSDAKMEQRLSVVTIGCANIDVMKTFYENKFNWKPIAENKDRVFFKMNGFLLSLCTNETLETISGAPPTDRGIKSITLSYNIDSKKEVDELYKNLQAKNVKILRAPAFSPDGLYFFTLTDPENNIIEIGHDPLILMDADGDVTKHKKYR